jgi:hypothetical protein
MAEVLHKKQLSENRTARRHRLFVLMQTIEYRIDAEPRQPALQLPHSQAHLAVAAFFARVVKWDLKLAVAERKWHSRHV